MSTETPDGLMRQIRNGIARAVLKMATASGLLQRAQVSVLDGELHDGVEHFEPYGYTSYPLPGSEVALAFVGGDRSHPVALVITDRRYRPTDMASGDVSLFDTRHQRVWLTKDGIIIDGAGLPVTVRNTPKVTMDTPELECTGNIRAVGDIQDRKDEQTDTMQSMRDIYNRHTHLEHGEDVQTDTPEEKML